MPLGPYWCQHNALLIPTPKRIPNNRNIINIGNNFKNLSVPNGIMKETLNNDKYCTISKAKEASMKGNQVTVPEKEKPKHNRGNNKTTTINTVVVK